MRIEGHDEQADDVPPYSFAEVRRIARLTSGRSSAIRYLSLGGDAKRRRTGMPFNPSTVSGCVRRCVYKASGAPEDPDHTIGDELLDTFDRGTVLGAWVAAIFRAADGHGGVSDVECSATDREERLSTDPEVGLGGFIDVAFRWFGIRRLSEVKSKKYETLSAMTSADKSQSKQLNDYQSMERVDAGSMIYVGTRPDEVMVHREFDHPRDDAAWEETKREVRTRMMMLRAPERLGPPSSNPKFECPACPWLKACRAGKTPAQLLREAEAAKGPPCP